MVAPCRHDEDGEGGMIFEVSETDKLLRVTQTRRTRRSLVGAKTGDAKSADEPFYKAWTALGCRTLRAENLK